MAAPKTRPTRLFRTTSVVRARLVGSVLCAVLLGACGDEPAAPEPPPPLPATVEVPAPTRTIAQVEIVEDMSEAVADRLLDLSDKLRRRDFGAAAGWFAPSFAGHALVDLTVAGGSDGHLGARQTEYDPASARIVGPADFVAGLERLIGPWSSVESVLWKVKGAEFQVGGGERWGKIKLAIRKIGRGPAGGPVSVDAWAYARVDDVRGQWMLTRFALTSCAVRELDRAVFTDVSTSAGVAHQGVRFGQPGNRSFAWNGAAVGDVDGDGRYDVFVPSDGRNFLYMARATEDGALVFREEAEERGVSMPDEGTGAVFFDFDNDGDQDLAVGNTGWRDDRGALVGRATELFVNVGGGRFEARGAALGLTDPLLSSSLTVLDYDGDGWLDLYVCGYGLVAREHNDSWIEATNGAPNALYRNLEGKGFRDVAAEAGVRGTSWTYASAAADYDGDGDLDLYVANDYGSNNLFKNRGDGTFEDVAAAAGVTDRGNGMGVAWGDLDADGALDLYVSNMSSTAGSRILGRLQDQIDPAVWADLKKLASGNTIFVTGGAPSTGANGSGGPRFRALPGEAGGVNASWAWSPVLADFDLDGALDVYCVNGFVTGDLPHDT